MGAYGASSGPAQGLEIMRFGFVCGLIFELRLSLSVAETGLYVSSLGERLQSEAPEKLHRLGRGASAGDLHCVILQPKWLAQE
jgi:hypothetical protein